MADKWESFLDEIITSDCKHFLWLRSLSYLEYIGYRKMVKAVPYEEVKQGVFHHLSDEIQHSYLLREQAEISFPNFHFDLEEFEDLMEIAEHYFQTLDHNIKNWVQEKTGQENPYLCYLLVSYTIEKRAMSVYPYYYSKLTQSPLKVVLQKIIKDESEHLRYLDNLIQNVYGDFLGKNFKPIEFEEKLFENYLQDMKQYGEKIESQLKRTHAPAI